MRFERTEIAEQTEQKESQKASENLLKDATPKDDKPQDNLGLEALRLLYVGLTRAQSQVVMWWAPTTNTPASGLHRLLFGRAPGPEGMADIHLATRGR